MFFFVPSSGMAASRKIIDLRNLLAGRFPSRTAPAASVLNTGLPVFDRTLVGGLPKSAITELISPQWSAGSASIIHSLLGSARRGQYFVALIDGSDSFDPCSAEKSSLEHLLWVRCRKVVEAVKAADLLLRDGNFPLVIMDLVLNAPAELGKIPQTTWYRLQRLAESSPSACLAMSRQSMVSSAQLKIVLENTWTLESLEHAISQLRSRIQRSHFSRSENAEATN